MANEITKSFECLPIDQFICAPDFYARAVRQLPAEGMAKLTSIFASVIKPIEAGGGKGYGCKCSHK